VTNDRNAAPRTPDAPPARDAVSSRSTEEEARDLLALRRAKRGDDGAFAELLRNNDEAIGAFIAALVGPEWFDRVSRDTYVHAYRGLPIAPPTAPRIWLLGIADGACRDALRRWGRAGGRDRPVELPPIPVGLPPEERLVLAAVEAAGLTPREAGRLVTGGADAARTLLAAARHHLDDELPLPPPPLRAAPFWNDLGRHLLVARSTPATSMAEDAAQRASGPGPVDGPSLQAGRAARGMARRVAERSPREVPWRRIGFACVLLATVGAVIFAALTFAHRASRRDAALGETATKVLVQVDQALARDNFVSGIATVSGARIDGLANGRYAISRSNTGSYRVTAGNGSFDEGYDVSRATSSRVVGGPTGVAQVRTGLAPGPPEWVAGAAPSAGDLLAASLRLVHRGTGGTVETTTISPRSTAPSKGTTTTTVPGRAVWVLRAGQPTRAAPDGSTRAMPGVGALELADVDEVRLVVDRSLVLPSRLELFRNGRKLIDVRFSNLSISQQPPAGAFTPPIPQGVQVTTTDGGFVPTAVGNIESKVGRSVVTPSYLPDGFVLSSSAVNEARRSVVLSYRNGSLQLAVTLRPARRGGAQATDPFGGDSVLADGARSLTISSGAFSQRKAWTSTAPVDHVWVAGPRMEAIVAGDPPVATLVKVVASLQ
jgi:DNA-directed RNA polymerase specialized sigma24 family protein